MTTLFPATRCSVCSFSSSLPRVRCLRVRGNVLKVTESRLLLVISPIVLSYCGLSTELLRGEGRGGFLLAFIILSLVVLRIDLCVLLSCELLALLQLCSSVQS